MQLESDKKIKFDRLIGQEHAKKFISTAIENNRLGHSYLFLGIPGTGKLAAAVDIAALLLNEQQEHEGTALTINQPNLKLIFPHPKTAKKEEIIEIKEAIVSHPYKVPQFWANPVVSIDSIRDLKHELGLKSHQGQNRVVIIHDAHTMTIEATNSLLKILEEPPDRTFFILTTSLPEKILPTVLSRCQHLRFNQLLINEIEQGLQKLLDAEISEDSIKLAARMASGSINRALQMLDEKLLEIKSQCIELMRAVFKQPSQMAEYAVKLTTEYDRHEIKQLLEVLQTWLRDAMLISVLGIDESIPLIVNIDEKEHLQKFAQNVPHFNYILALRELGNCINMVERYVQPQLILLVMLKKLRVECAGKLAKKAA